MGQNLITSFSFLSAMSILLGAVGVLLWWLIRIKQKRIWLPTVRLLTLKEAMLPKLKLRPPDVIAMLCFLLLCVVFIFFTTQPKEKIMNADSHERKRIHLFLDLSPSMLASSSIQGVIEKIGAIYSLLEDSQITFSTSSDNQVYKPASIEELQEIIFKRGFHKAGLEISLAIKPQLERIGKVDRLVLLSDRDAFSWTGFNWQFLADDMEVLLVDLSEGKNSYLNLFFNRAVFISSPHAPTMDWDVEIEGRGHQAEQKGVLVASHRDQELIQVPFVLPENKSRVTVRASWPKKKFLDLNKDGGGHIVWKIERLKDDLLIDNEFRTGVAGVGQSVLVVANSGGEQILDDPVYQLMVTLEVLDFRPRRFDWLQTPLPSWDTYPLWILHFDQEKNLSRFCPRDLAMTRMASHLRGEAEETQRRLPRVWLVPNANKESYRSVCHCYHQLMLSKTASDDNPSYCKEIYTNSELNVALRSMGANQVGGEFGREEQAFAWIGSDETSGMEVVAFSVPLQPRRFVGMSHARLPVMLRSILQWQGFLTGGSHRSGGKEVWPRIENIVRFWGGDALSDEKMSELQSQIQRSNVPVGESLLFKLQKSDLPPIWNPNSQLASVTRFPVGDDQEDPLPWIELCLWLVLLILVIEALWFVRKTWKRRVKVVLFFSCLFVEPLEARIRIAALTAKPTSHQQAFYMLAKEVRNRTSLGLDKNQLVVHSFEEADDQPWLWTRGMSRLVDRDGDMSFKVANWLRRGGFLILEQSTSMAPLKKMTERVFGSEHKDQNWSPIPVDHELMRSFYLLDSLPTCNGQVWNGFMFDGRLTALAIPYSLLDSLGDRSTKDPCVKEVSRERSMRLFVNILMVALATDYKKDQIHMREILKRLR